MEKIKFSIYQPMKSGQYEQSVRKYKKLQGKSGRSWYVSIQDNPGDYIFLDPGEPNSDGFGGATLEFELEDGTIDRVKGPWHSNSSALLTDTGHDVTDKHFTRGIISKSIEYDKSDFQPIYSDILHYDEEPVLGKFNRIDELAEKFSKENQCDIYYAKKSDGGGSSGTKQYEKI